MHTINSALSWWMKSRGDRVAISLGGEDVLWRDWVPWIDRCAGRLIDLGVETGDRVNICAANSIEYCTLTMAIMRVGGIVAPLNTRFTDHELCEIVEDHSPKLIVAADDQRGKFTSCGVPIVDIAEFAALQSGPAAQIDREISPDNPVVIISTSGSTAKPKGVLFSHRTMLAYIQATVMEDNALSDGGGVVVVAPLATSAGMVQLVHYAVLGCTLYFEPMFVADRFLEILQSKKVVNFAGAPAFFERIAECPGFAEADLSGLKAVYVGGARVTRALFDAWKAKGLFIRQTYGQTEAGGNSTIMPAKFAEEFPEKCGWGGIFTQHRIVDGEGKDVPPDTEGQILIRGPGMMLGYWNNPAATAEAIQDGWLHTGDIGKMDEQGLITFVDRMKDIIISGGLNISAAEIERAVTEFPAIAECAVIAAADERFQETPLAVITSADEIDIEALIAHCNDRLADFKVPRYVVQHPEALPRTATQKISKPDLRETYANVHETHKRVR